MSMLIKKADAKKRLVFAEVYAPNRPDSDGEFMDADDIEKMAYAFMKSMKLDQVDTNHDGTLVEGAMVVESFIARKGDPDFIEGSWVVGVHVANDKMWEAIEKGDINGFSVEAWVKKDEVEVEVEIPSVLQGRTLKHDDDHDHSFFVAYDDDGRFLGGRTDVVNGHYHVIKRGTVTEESDSHKHKFSHVEDVVLREIGASA